MLRFGRKLPLPSTLQIRRELGLMDSGDALVEEARSALEGVMPSAKYVADLVDKLSAKHGISFEGTRALVSLIVVPKPRRPKPRAA